MVDVHSDSTTKKNWGWFSRGTLTPIGVKRSAIVCHSRLPGLSMRNLGSPGARDGLEEGNLTKRTLEGKSARCVSWGLTSQRLHDFVNTGNLDASCTGNALSSCLGRSILLPFPPPLAFEPSWLSQGLSPPPFYRTLKRKPLVCRSNRRTVVLCQSNRQTEGNHWYWQRSHTRHLYAPCHVRSALGVRRPPWPLPSPAAYPHPQ